MRYYSCRESWGGQRNPKLQSNYSVDLTCDTLDEACSMPGVVLGVEPHARWRQVLRVELPAFPQLLPGRSPLRRLRRDMHACVRTTKGKKSDLLLQCNTHNDEAKREYEARTKTQAASRMVDLVDLAILLRSVHCSRPKNVCVCVCVCARARVSHCCQPAAPPVAQKLIFFCSPQAW